MRLELSLLLSSARVHMDSQNAEKIKRLLHGDIDWGFFCQEALHHRGAPLVYFNLKAICPEIIPGYFLDFLRNALRNNAGRNLLMAAELLRILRLF